MIVPDTAGSAIKPGDGSQPVSRPVLAPLNRNRSLLFATATSGLARAISVALNALTIPIAVRALGADGYGLWTTIISVTSFLVFADFGLSNGLVAVISEAHGKQDREGAVRAVSTTFFVLLGLAVALSAVVGVAGPYVPWAGMLNLSDSRMAKDVNGAVVWFLILQIANLPALVSQKVQIGYQEMHWTNGWQILGSVFSFLGVLVAASKGLGIVPFIVLFSVGPLLAQVAGSYVLFTRLRPWLAPKIGAVRWDSVRDLSGTGGVFVLMQVFAFFGNSSDQIILTRYLGLGAAAEYSLTQRLFSGASLIQFFLLPLWPAFGAAIAGGDHKWARLALKRTLVISIAVSTGCAAIMALGAPIISARWVPQIRGASPAVLAGFVAMSVVVAYGGTMSALLNNRQSLRAHLRFYAVASIGAVAAKVLLVKTVGISGVLWGTFLGYGLLYTIPAWNLAQKTLMGEPPAAGMVESR